METLGRDRCKCEDNIKMNLREVGFENIKDANWIKLALKKAK
jgi:hypothetical protein